MSSLKRATAAVLVSLCKHAEGQWKIAPPSLIERGGDRPPILVRQILTGRDQSSPGINRASISQTKLHLRRCRQNATPTAPSANPPSEPSSGITTPDELIWPGLIRSPGSA